MLTIPEFLAPALARDLPNAIGDRAGDGPWTFLGTKELAARIDAVACALRASGVNAGDRVALVANNSVDWAVLDLGIIFGGAVCVPLFATQALDQVQFIMENCAAKIVFLETRAAAERFAPAIPAGVTRIVIEGTGPGSLAEFEARGAAIAAAQPNLASGYAAERKPHDLAVLIYTSGTTGDPKGVMLSHANLTWDADAAFEYAYPAPHDGEPVLSVLPFAHIYEHTSLLGYLARCFTLYVTVPDRLGADLRDARPTAINLVPRIYERILAGIVGKARAEGGARAKLVPWALGVGRDYMRARATGTPPDLALRLQYSIARSLVLRKLRPLLGLDRLDHATSGSAPLHPDIGYTYAAADIVICEGYGLTESSPVISTNRVSDNRIGTVGRPLPGVEVKIAGDGEVLARGPNVMLGYYRRPDETPIDAAGWFSTGDIGEFDADGYLMITDRKKELLKTSNGKYVAPARVEAAIKRSLLIGQVFLVGDGRPHPAALVAPNWELVRRELDLEPNVPTNAIASIDRVRELMRKEVVEQTADLASFEQVRRIAVLPRDLTIEDGELSPTLKVKRRVVEKRYAKLIEAAYAEDLHVAAVRA